MHIVLGLLGTIITILILLNRLAEAGIDLGGLNPYLWNRRRKWRNQYQGDPVFKIESPMDATAILMVAAAKADGDMTKEDKSLILDLFENEFKLSKKDAAGLLISSVHLLGDGNQVRSNLKKFLSPSKASFTDTQAQSALSLISRSAGEPDTMHVNAQELLKQVTAELASTPTSPQTW
ncbi:MAG: TerB family tellurite resistance protein [Gammaproteobacteria bacterium]|jgi:hypothetical protein|nr:TerB family tellurite resistance protein [Gammaproteobacteria bacterium]